MISELAELGELETQAFYDAIPDIDSLHAEECFLAWRFFLTTSKPESAISEIFEWVEDDADIEIVVCGGLFETDLTDDSDASIENTTPVKQDDTRPAEESQVPASQPIKTTQAGPAASNNAKKPEPKKSSD